MVFMMLLSLCIAGLITFASIPAIVCFSTVLAILHAVACVPAVMGGHVIAVILAVACYWRHCCCMRHFESMLTNAQKKISPCSICVGYFLRMLSIYKQINSSCLACVGNFLAYAQQKKKFQYLKVCISTCQVCASKFLVHAQHV